MEKNFEPKNEVIIENLLNDLPEQLSLGMS
jgi:hypothetical protein